MVKPRSADWQLQPEEPLVLYQLARSSKSLALRQLQHRLAVHTAFGMLPFGKRRDCKV